MEEKLKKLTEVSPTERVPKEQNTTEELKRKERELNELRKKVKQEEEAKENVEGLKPHFHCANQQCNAVFYTKEKQTLCYKCRH